MEHRSRYPVQRLPLRWKASVTVLYLIFSLTWASYVIWSDDFDPRATSYLTDVSFPELPTDIGRIIPEMTVDVQDPQRRFELEQLAARYDEARADDSATELVFSLFMGIVVTAVACFVVIPLAIEGRVAA